VTRETLQQIWKEIDRLIAETQSVTYEVVIARVRAALPSPGFCALFLPVFGKLLPGADNREKFEEYLDQIETREKFENLILSLEELKPEELDRFRSIFRSITPGLRDILDKAKDTLKPLGGPSEKLASNVQIGEIVDRINRTKREEAETLKNLFLRFAPEVGLKPRTLRRKYETEMRRRNSLRGDAVKPSNYA
jgi:hypothetical protein